MAEDFILSAIPRLYDVYLSATPGARAMYNKVSNNAIESIVGFGKTKNPVRILEIGAGTCLLSITFLEKYLKLDPSNRVPIHYIALDPSKRMLRRGQKKLEQFVEKNKLKDLVTFTFNNVSSKDLMNIGIQEGSLDVVVSTLTFHHIDPQGKMNTFRDLFKLLNPNHGKLIVSDFFLHNGPSFNARLAYGLIYYADCKHVESNADMPRMISDAGFKEVSNVKIGKLWNTEELDLFQATKEGDAPNNAPIVNQ